MPHASHRKKKSRQQRQLQHLASRNKRGEIKCEDGWTKIARSDKTGQTTVLGSHQDRRAPRVMEIAPDDDQCDDHSEHSPVSDEGWTRLTIKTDPADAPEGATLETALTQYRKREVIWKSSHSWAELRRTLNHQITKDLEAQSHISNCLCFGLSSPTGLIRPGIDRRNVAMYQLAVFKSIIDTIGEHYQPHKKTPEAFAQDPVFNELDTSLLAAVEIKVVQHPEAFHKVTPTTFAFCPGAEQFVTRGVLFRQPAMYLGSSSLETYVDTRTGQERSPYIREIFGACYHHSDDDDDDVNNNKNDAVEAPIQPSQQPPSPSKSSTPLHQPQPQPLSDPSSIHQQEHRKQGKIPLRAASVPTSASSSESRGAEILHNFKHGKRCFKLPDFDGHDYALYNLHLFW